jgi:catechol 2,3-dioxygenase-like lactoylglutathione lyase family enzyme
MADIITGLHAVTIHVRDIELARTFYSEVLGLKELNFDAKAKRLVFALPGTSTLLSMHIPDPGEEGRDPGTASGVIFHHPDPRVACAELARRGGTITLEPTTVQSPFGEFVRAAFSDPDGNEFVISNRTD